MGTDADPKSTTLLPRPVTGSEVAGPRARHPLAPELPTVGELPTRESGLPRVRAEPEEVVGDELAPEGREVVLELEPASR